ncbi:MAG: hypothetical protein ACU4EQ_04765 [Candidatus Nitrosoglobus sp.]
MENNYFPKFANIIRNLPASSLNRQSSLEQELLLEQEGRFSIYYAPFDYVNLQARIVLIGITPGLLQAQNAVREAHLQLNADAPLEQAAIAAKKTGSFSGPMRTNLVDMLDYFQINRWLGLQSTSALFGVHADLVHYESVLRYPTFIDGKNYSGTPSILRQPFLQKQVERYFFPVIAALPNAIFVPLGDKVKEVCNWAVEKGLIDITRLLQGIPHPC